MLTRSEHPTARRPIIRPRPLAEVTIRHQEAAAAEALLSIGALERDGQGASRSPRACADVEPLPVRYRLHYAGGVLDAHPGDRFQQPDGEQVRVESLVPGRHTLPGRGLLRAVEDLGGWL